MQGIEPRRLAALLALVLAPAAAHAQWQLLSGPAADAHPARGVYSESPARNRIMWLRQADSQDLVLMFSISGTNGLHMQPEQLAVRIDNGPFIALGKLALQRWQDSPKLHAFPFTANGQTFSIRLAKAGQPARQGTLLRQMMDGQSLQVRYYLTTGQGQDVTYPLMGFKPLAVQYFDLPPELEAGEAARYERCQASSSRGDKAWRRCLGRFAPPEPGI